jgi:hypothetical protein
MSTDTHRLTQREENSGVKICVYLWLSVDKFLMWGCEEKRAFGDAGGLVVGGRLCRRGSDGGTENTA